MSSTGPITIGMPVYGCDTRPIGPVEGLAGEGLQVRGHQIPGAAIARVTGGAVHLRVAGGALLARRDPQTAGTSALPQVDGTTPAASPGEDGARVSLRGD